MRTSSPHDLDVDPPALYCSVNFFALLAVALVAVLGIAIVVLQAADNILELVIRDELTVERAVLDKLYESCPRHRSHFPPLHDLIIAFKSIFALARTRV